MPAQDQYGGVARKQAASTPQPRRQVRFEDLELLGREPVEHPANLLKTPCLRLVSARCAGVVCVKFSKLVMVTGCWFISGQEQHPFVRSN